MKLKGLRDRIKFYDWFIADLERERNGLRHALDSTEADLADAKAQRESVAKQKHREARRKF